jgi:hypothetical protein
LREAGYPDGFWSLVKRMTACDPATRPSLEEVLGEFEGLCAPVECCHAPELARLREEIVSVRADGPQVVLHDCVFVCVRRVVLGWL